MLSLATNGLIWLLRWVWAGKWVWVDFATPSNQTPLNSATRTSSNISGDENPLGASSSVNDYEIENPLSQSLDNSGLLDALLVESQTLGEKSKGKEVLSAVASDKGKGVMVEASTEEEDSINVDSVFKTSGETSAENHWDDLLNLNLNHQLVSYYSFLFNMFDKFLSMKPAEDPLEEMNSMDDDLASLLTNFPSAMPIPEWYRGGRHLSNGQSSSVDSDNVRLDTQQSASPAPVTNTTEPELEWGLSPCYWKNLPGIC
nr:hypothetical protein CFP56_49602 [Quercus suber]